MVKNFKQFLIESRSYEKAREERDDHEEMYHKIKMQEEEEEYFHHFRELDENKIKKVKSLLNSFIWKPTDDKYTYDFMVKNEETLIEEIMKLNKNEMFEVILGLNENGIKHLKRYFTKWVSLNNLFPHEISNIKKAISAREELI